MTYFTLERGVNMQTSAKMGFFLPTLSLFGPMSYRDKFKRIKEAGFDGTEILITRWNRHKLPKLQGMARDMGLAVTYHQPWSLEENNTHFFSYALTGIGYLPWKGYPLEWVLENVPMSRRVVLYPDRMKEIWGEYECAYQTTSVLDRDGNYKVPLEDFVLETRRGLKPVVFDTQHVLEYALVPGGGVEKLGNYTREQLLSRLENTWNDLDGNERVVELHWNDCNPSLGHTGGRNVLPGTGILPLPEFARFVREQGWIGTVVPEIKPSVFRPHSVDHLKRVKETVQKHFI